jgi:hypothetical protein
MPAAQAAEASGPGSGAPDLKGENPLNTRKGRLFMGSCSCGCNAKSEKKDNPGANKKSFICYQCNTFKDAPTEAPAPECCGKKMQEMD